MRIINIKSMFFCIYLCISINLQQKIQMILYRIIPLFFLAFFIILKGQNKLSSQQIDHLITKTTGSWDSYNIDSLNILYKLSDEIGYEKGKYRSLATISNWYMQKAQYQKAIPYLKKIENLDIHDPANYIYKVRGISSKGYALSALGFYEDAQVAIDKSIKLSSKIVNEDDRNELSGQAYDIQAFFYIETKKGENSILQSLRRAVFFYSKISNIQKRKERLRSAYVNMSTSFLSAKLADSALIYSYKALSMKNANPMYEDLNAAYIYQSIGQTYLKLDKIDSALVNYNKAEKIAKKIGDPLSLKGCYMALATIYEKKGEKEKSLFYGRKYVAITDSLSSAKRDGVAEVSKEIKKEILKEQQNEKKKLYLIITCIIVSLLLLLFFSVRVFRRYRSEKEKRSLREDEILNQKHELLEAKLKINDAFNEVTDLAKKNDPSFLTRFKEVYPDFCNDILSIYPNIVNSELAFLALLRLNFSTKEIAAITFITPKSVQNKKNRIRKKLNIPSEDDIYLWLSKLG